jgi:hypothetical protein
VVVPAWDKRAADESGARPANGFASTSSTSQRPLAASRRSACARRRRSTYPRRWPRSRPDARRAPATLAFDHGVAAAPNSSLAPKPIERY